jgi:hypothetical protein
LGRALAEEIINFRSKFTLGKDHHNRWLMLIAAFKLGQALLFIAVGVGALRWWQGPGRCFASPGSSSALWARVALRRLRARPRLHCERPHAAPHSASALFAYAALGMTLRGSACISKKGGLSISPWDHRIVSALGDL